jgi:hypothetical protein
MVRNRHAHSWWVIFLGSILLIAAGICLAWSAWPAPKRLRATNLPGLSSAALQVNWPGWLPVGRSGWVRLKIAPSEVFQPVAPPAFPGQSRQVVEARLELPGVFAAPQGIIRQAWLPDQSLEFSWQVQPPLAGEYSGSIWLHLLEAENRRLLAVQEITIQATTLAGFAFYPAQVFGAVGGVLGVALLSVALWPVLFKRKIFRDQEME